MIQLVTAASSQRVGMSLALATFHIVSQDTAISSPFSHGNRMSEKRESKECPQKISSVCLEIDRVITLECFCIRKR